MCKSDYIKLLVFKKHSQSCKFRKRKKKKVKKCYLICPMLPNGNKNYFSIYKQNKKKNCANLLIPSLAIRKLKKKNFFSTAFMFGLVAVAHQKVFI